MKKSLCVMQVLPELEVGGVERGSLEIAHALVAAGHRALVVSGGGRLVGELEAGGAEHITLDVGAKRPASLAHIARLARLYREHDVDIVHARSRLPAWLAWLARRRLGDHAAPRWVTTVHGPYSVNRYSRIMVSGEAVIAISSFIADYIARHYPEVPAQRITTIARGVDPDRYYPDFAPDPAWRASWSAAHPELAGRALLTLPGRLTRWKGQLDFIALIAELRRRGQPVHGLIVGAAHKRKRAFENELRMAVRRRGLDADISFLGDRSDLREILAISACAYSLTSEPEAFGRTTIEALALGTPVIGYDHGGTGEILARVFPAGTVAPGDVYGAADRSEQLLRNTPAVPRTHPYTTTVMQEQTLALYERLYVP